MPFTDMPLDDLRAYRPQVRVPDDFEDFWRRTLAEADQHDLNVRLEPVDNRQALVDAYEVTYAGFGGADIKAWLIVPGRTRGPLPTVVSYLGYSCGRGIPFASHWVAAGFANLIMDTRGQGWNTATIFEPTADADLQAGAAGAPGHMTRGIHSPDDYYYRRVYIDALRAVQAAQTLDLVDPTRVVVQGGSQGGGLSIAAAGLASMAGVSLAGAMIDVPFLCHFERAITLADAGPYPEISRLASARPGFLDRMLETLSYVDGVNLARWAEVPAIFSVALMDPVCPASTVFAAYNAWSDRHEETPEQVIKVYPHNGHEGGREIQTWECLGWLQELLG